MKLSAVLLARTLAFVDINELNPRGAVFLPLLVPHLVERFSFQKFPSKPEDFEEGKGVVFKDGYINGQTIEDFTVYSDGIKLDVRSSTSQGRTVLLETLEWLAAKHGISYREGSISRWNYVSNLAFNTEVDLDIIAPAITALTRRISLEMKDDRRVTDGFHVEALNIDVDRTFGAKQIAPFTLQRRAGIAYSEGKYFSAAPLPTDIHISIIEEFEENVRKQGWKHEGR